MRTDMIKKKRLALLYALFVMLFPWSPGAQAEELEIVNRPINSSGLTGLLMTSSPYTQTPGTVEIGASIASENSIRPDYTITEYPFSATVGMTTNSEFGFKCSYYNITEGPTGTRVISRKTGDIELLYKWNFMPQPEDSLRPGFALIIGGLVPTDTNNDKLSSVSHWGARLGLVTGSEISWKEYVLGLYADGQLVGKDLTDKRLSDTYWMFNAGMLLPISKYRNLQLFTEYSLITGKDVTSLSGGDTKTLTYGLRLVTERFNLTIGSQSLRKNLEGYDNSGRVIGLMSFKFQ